MVSNFAEMRIFLCKQEEPDWKFQLIDLFKEQNVPGEFYVSQMETMHPEVLKIGKIILFFFLNFI